MNILMIAPTAFFADRGCHVRIYEEARTLQELGHRVVIVTYHLGQDVPGLDVRRIPGICFWYKKVEVGPSWWKPLIDGVLLLRSLWVSRSMPFDLILAHLHEGGLVGWFCSRLRSQKIPLVFDYQGSLTGELLAHHFIRRHRGWHWFFRLIEGWVDRAADRIICSSAAGTRDLVEHFGVDPAKVFTLADAVNTQEFSPAPPHPLLKERLGIPLGKTVVGYLGVLSEYQGIDLLLQAARLTLHQHPQAHFLIMGYPNEAKYRAMAAKLGIAQGVTFTGRVPYVEAPAYLRLVDIAVSPKISRAEANGKLYAYMACGLPCVVFDSEVNREILGELGVYARFGDAQDLAAQMGRLVADEALRRDLGHRLREQALRTCSWEARGELLSDLLVEFLRGSKVQATVP